MIPPLDDQRWDELLTGRKQHQFRSVPAGLMFSRLRRQLESDGSPSSFDRCRLEARAFFEKYEKILADDITAIFT
jgi:hypothetical protein